MTRKEDQRGLSISTITVGVLLVTAYFLWGASCAMYQAASPPMADGAAENLEVRPVLGGRTSGLIFAVTGIATFVVKSITMLPKLPLVIGFLFRERLWYVVVSFGILASVVLFGVFLKRMELALDGPRKRKRRRKR